MTQETKQIGLTQPQQSRRNFLRQVAVGVGAVTVPLTVATQSRELNEDGLLWAIEQIKLQKWQREVLAEVLAKAKSGRPIITYVPYRRGKSELHSQLVMAEIFKNG